VTAAQLAEWLEQEARSLEGDGNAASRMDLTTREARAIAAQLRRVEALEKALDELRVLTDGIVAQRGPLGDATVDRILRRAKAALRGGEGA